MLIEHRGRRPRVHPTAYIAPTATLCGHVTVGPESRVLFGAVLTAEGAPVVIGAHCILMEGAVLRGAPTFPLTLGDHVLVGPHAYLSGCAVEESVFLAAGSSVFNGAQAPLNFPRTVFGLDRSAPGESFMPALTRRYAVGLARHRNDRVLDDEPE